MKTPLQLAALAGHNEVTAILKGKAANTEAENAVRSSGSFKNDHPPRLAADVSAANGDFFEKADAKGNVAIGAVASVPVNKVPAAATTAAGPWHVRLWRRLFAAQVLLWRRLSEAREADGAGGWLLRRGWPMFSAVLFCYDVASDAVLARDLFTNGYTNLGGLVLIFMLSHYVPTYLMILRAVNQFFFTQRKLLPAAAASKASTGLGLVGLLDPSIAGSAATAAMAAGQLAASVTVLESLHLFFYVLLVLFGLPLVPLIDAYMVLTAVFLPVDPSEAGYVMRSADDFCRQYERIRLPLECFMESLPQTGLQIYLYTRTQAGAARGIEVSQAVLLTSLLGSVLNLVSISWELFNSFRASGSTPMEYLAALISLQLSRLALTQGSDGAASSLNQRSPYMTGSAAVGRGLAQVILAPHPRTPGLLEALTPLLSTVLAPRLLDLNVGAFTELRVEDSAAVAACLALNVSVEALQMRATGLGPETLRLLLPGLRAHPSLVSLDLSLNALGDVGVAELAAVVCHLPHLTSLALDNLEDAGTFALEWLCFLFQQRTGKAAKSKPADSLKV
ncbi:hypothetical protein GPECTOR_104g90 [Gonium pectorale]|uniref:Uncharacterized protein n=1 Tax=Gonium pectorale TaxID=33097 RepID=A0A150FZR5_GONPE|nr:hypothetical protein GPECTOR_104g90 [Gonium pectorale]|eukprot:KXZ43084.1 hypothetical protein GPECTOR_104g90 [Gonium pectorale]